jgi:hypothetical protein
MTTYVWLFTVWGLITLTLIALLIYRSRLTREESDWIPLTDDAREERAIQIQTTIEMKTRKLSLPIRALGIASVLMLLVILGFWLYQGIMTPPPAPK